MTSHGPCIAAYKKDTEQGDAREDNDDSRKAKNRHQYPAKVKR